MKNLHITILVLTAAFLITSCGVNDPNYYDYTAPSIPTGVKILNGDQRVDVSWNRVRDNDLAGYNIYFSYEYDGRYELIGSTTNNYFVDAGISNGVRYYYSVTSYDYNGNESELSLDVVYATARPEGFNQAIFDYLRFPNTAGYSFANYSVVRYNAPSADFFFENYNGTYYLVVWDDTDIQDMGSTHDIYDIAFAPIGGWSSTKDEIARVGHTYVIWTVDNHFAKIRVKSISPDRIVFDWAYQLVEGDPQLKPVKTHSTRGELKRSFSIR